MDLGNYVQVHDRLLMALEKYPELRVQELDANFVEVPEGMVLVCRVSVWRTPDDPVPTIASASEPYPGRTPYTKGSERMVGFTSALGRCLGYMGFGIAGSMASANEVEARRAPSEAPRTPQEARPDRPRTTSTAPASDAQKRLLRSLKYAGDPEQLTKASASDEIERLKAAQIQAEFPGAIEEEPF